MEDTGQSEIENKLLAFSLDEEVRKNTGFQMAKVIIVGLDDPYGKTPLQPDILASSGQKLWKMSGLTMTRYVQSFDRRNLFEMNDKRDMFTARRNAMTVINSIDKRYVNTYIICLGRIVATAFDLHNVRPLVFKKVQTRTRAVYLPHTSGLNRWYNDADNAAQAATFMRQLGAVASGEEDDMPGIENPEYTLSTILR